MRGLLIMRVLVFLFFIFTANSSLSDEYPFAHCNLSNRSKDDNSELLQIAKKFLELDNYELGRSTYQLLAELCEPKALEWYGFHFSRSENFKQNAWSWRTFKKAADYGERFSQLLVGTAYYEGNEFLNQDYQKAAKYLSMAWENNVLEVGGYLAHLYFFGNGVEKSINKAVQIAKRAEKARGAPLSTGDNDSLIGYMHLLGSGLELNDLAALEYFEKALTSKAPNYGAAYLTAITYALNDMPELALLWVNIYLTLAGPNDLAIDLAALLAKDLPKSITKKLPEKARDCISNGFSVCFYDDLRGSRYKPHSILRVVYNKHSFQDKAAIQYQLKKLGKYQGKIDAIWGKNTESAVVNYATERGIFTRNTLALYNTILGEGPSPTFKKPPAVQRHDFSELDAFYFGSVVGSYSDHTTRSLKKVRRKYDPFETLSQTGYRQLLVNGKYLSCYYYANTKQYVGCR